MPRRDLFNNNKLVQGLAPAAHTATATSAWIDTAALGCQSVMFAVNFGVITDGSYTITLEDAELTDKSDVATVTGKAVQSETGALAVAATDDGQVREVGYLGFKRYVRCKVAATGTTTGAIYGITAAVGHFLSSPVRAYPVYGVTPDPAPPAQEYYPVPPTA